MKMDSVRNLLLAGLGALGYSQEMLKGVVHSLIERGEITREQGEKLLAECVRRGQEEQAKFSERIAEETRRVVEKLPLVTRQEFDALRRRVDDLEQGRTS